MLFLYDNDTAVHRASYANKLTGTVFTHKKTTKTGVRDLTEKIMCLCLCVCLCADSTYRTKSKKKKKKKPKRTENQQALKAQRE